jgi:hypothetical protein
MGLAPLSDSIHHDLFENDMANLCSIILTPRGKGTVDIHPKFAFFYPRLK